jgi:hypothetical protein
MSVTAAVKFRTLFTEVKFGFAYPLAQFNTSIPLHGF